MPRPEELAPGTVELPSVPLKTYPGVHIPMPLAPWIFDPDRWDFDICFAQTTSLLLEFGIWLRKMKGVPLLCVNTTHLVAAYDVLLPERLSKNEMLQAGVHLTLTRPFERLFSSIYNQSDGLVVLSEGLRAYWRERGVTAPIHVIPRAVQPEVFDRPLGEDPYTHLIAARVAAAGGPAADVRRAPHAREGARPRHPDLRPARAPAGARRHAHARRRRARHASTTGASRASSAPSTASSSRPRCPGRRCRTSTGTRTSSCTRRSARPTATCSARPSGAARPSVAFADGMGVTAQIQDGVNGVLFAPGKGDDGGAAADAAFGRAVVELIRDPQARARLGKAAARRARERCSPFAVQQRIADAFQHAQDHARGLRVCAPWRTARKMMQWLTTLRHARPWTTFNGLIYLGGHLRPAKTDEARAHAPRIGS